MQEVPKRILIRMPNWIGDLVMGTPILTQMRKRFPLAHITAACQGKLGQLLECDPSVDQVLVFNKPKSRREKAQIIQQFREVDADLGILLTNSFSSAWWFWRAGVKRRLGFNKGWRTPLLTHPLNFPEAIETQHLVLTYQELLEPLGGSSSTAPNLFVTPDELVAAHQQLTSLGVGVGVTIVGINPGAAYGSAKCWLPERFREVTERLLEDSSIVVLYFGDAAGEPLVRKICSGLPNRVISLAGSTSLRQLMALISLCDVFLTNDSGPMHLAAALKRPLVALFGSTSDLKTGPYGIGCVIHKHVECSPCYRRECPIDLRCMTRITSDEVYGALMQELTH